MPVDETERAWPFVSVLVPCRNEELFIAGCLDAVSGNDYPSDRLEILLIDGISTDGTPAVLRRYAKLLGNLVILENPLKTTPISLNMGVRHARGEIIIRVDAHAKVASDYLRRCVETLVTSGADNVGGVMKTLPQTDGIFAEAVMECLSHRFGVGGSTFRTGVSTLVEADTVFGGCYRRDVFDRIGYWNENLVRSQDIEFNRRLKKAGGRILLNPEIVSSYYARSDAKSFLRHNWTNGVWAILPFLYSDVTPVSSRHLLPLAFALAVLGSAILALASRIGIWLFGGIVVAYGAACVIASLAVALRRRSVRFLALMSLTFAMLHLAYGLGSVWGIVQVTVRVCALPFKRAISRDRSSGERA